MQPNVLMLPLAFHPPPTSAPQIPMMMLTPHNGLLAFQSSSLFVQQMFKVLLVILKHVV